jgi:hypothetical protein
MQSNRATTNFYSGDKTNRPAKEWLRKTNLHQLKGLPMTITNTTTNGLSEINNSIIKLFNSK